MSIIGNTITDFTKDGKCISCGECCPKMLPMTDKELARIKRYVERNNIKPSVRFPFLTHYVDNTCAFLTIEKKCAIYSVRPKICKDFVCNQSMQRIEYQKQKAHKEGKLIDTRNEFKQK